MTKTIKYLVWFFLTTILLSGFVITKRAFAEEVTQEMIVLSHQYNRVFADMLIKKIVKFHKDYPVILFLKDGKKVVGVFKAYSKSDESIWILENKHIFQTGYGVMELLDVRVLMQEPV
jgi:hypothetical protein